MKPSLDSLKNAMSNKSDDELCDILYVHREEFEAEAVRAAQDELERRGLNAETLTRLRGIAEEHKKFENDRLGWRFRLVAFFISTVALGIPAILAHRHYTELGARGKARDWSRWALFGFMFYLAIGVVFRMISQ